MTLAKARYRQNLRPPVSEIEAFQAGVYAPWEKVMGVLDAIHKKLFYEREYELEHYKGVGAYGFAYYQGRHQFREEPLLVDQGSLMLGDYSIMRIVLRSGAMQEELRSFVEETIHNQGILCGDYYFEEGKSCLNDLRKPFAEGTVVYSLKMRKDHGGSSERTRTPKSGERLLV